MGKCDYYNTLFYVMLLYVKNIHILKPEFHLLKSLHKLPHICALARPYFKLEKFAVLLKRSIYAAKCAAKYVNGILPLALSIPYTHSQII